MRTLRFWSDRGVDGFRIDVAHMLTKDLTEPLPSQAELDACLETGSTPPIDRDDVHEVYAEWRAVFNSYDPPRTAVAEAWVDPSRVPLYASAESLGQAFNFDLLEADFDAGQFRRIVTDNLELAAASRARRRRGCSPTTTSSGTPRATDCRIRRATPTGGPRDKHGNEWLLSGGTQPALDRAGDFAARGPPPSSCSGCPGSAYLYQGEELGLHEVAEDRRCRTAGPDVLPQPRGGHGTGRAGCRVPLPWTRTGSSFGFGDDGAHLPQPAWFGADSVEAQDGDHDSTLTLYRRALALRHELQSGEELDVDRHRAADVLWFDAPERVGGRHELRRRSRSSSTAPTAVLASIGCAARESCPASRRSGSRPLRSNAR